MPSAKAALATLVLGGGGATAGAAMGGAFSSSSSNEIPEGKVDNKVSGSSLDSTTNVNNTLVDTNRDNTSGTVSGNEIVNPEVVVPASEAKVEKVKVSWVVANGYGEGTIAKNKEKFLVNPYSDESKTFWNKAFKLFEGDGGNKEETSTDKFSKYFGKGKVTVAFDEKEGNVATSLNKVCAYQYRHYEDWVNLGLKENKKVKQDLWKYCSPLGVAPTTVAKDSKSNYGTSKIGNTKKDKLLSTKENSVLWTLKQDELKAEEAPSAYFADVKTSVSSDALKTKCEAAYQLEALAQANEVEDTTKPKEETLLKYCSIEQPTATTTVVGSSN